jgi:hypothetical protein
MPDESNVHAQLVMKQDDGKSIFDLPQGVTAASGQRTAGDLPRQRIDEIRRRLTEAGFSVEGGNSNTLSIAGPAALFGEVFGLDPAAAVETGSAAHATRIRRDFEPYVADVFVPPAPEFFP